MTKREKLSCWLPILILSGLGISVAPNQVLPRTSEVSRALSPLLSSYEVIRTEPGEIERQVRTTGELRFQFNDTDFYFNLEPHDLRAPNYRAEATGPGGARRTLPPQPVHTFKGVLAGREDTRGRFNLTDGGVEGVVYAPGGWYYVEPVRNYLPSAPAGELVVYRHVDLKPVEGIKCGVSLPERLQRGVARVATQAGAATSTNPTNYVADVATEADYEYVQAAGGAEEANREIEGILNVVEGVFQSELLVQLRISFQHAWEVEEDPYTGTTMSSLIIELRRYWNENFAAEQDYDLVHAWSGKQNLNKIGKAAGRVCHPGETNWPISTSVRITSSDKYFLAAHEIAHNVGAGDLYNHIPPILSCTGTLMERLGPELTFCQFSRDQIAEHLSGYNSCLDTQPITLQPPSGLSAKAASASVIDLAWRDNSANETGFMVERRRHGSGAWVQIGTTAAETEAFTSEGLFSEATYLYRVQAFNDSESSAYSNEASATTGPSAAVATGWRIDTIAGRTDNDGDGGAAVEARLAYPDDVAVDGSGALYIADTEHHRIRRVDASGRITTVAGTGARGFGGDGGPAVAARLNGPTGIAVDSEGALYIADRENQRIRRVDGAGRITTVAGTGEQGYSYSENGGPAVAARLTYPSDVALDGSGNLYIADTGNRVVRRVDAGGIITTVAGNGGRGYGGGDGRPAVRVSLNFPTGVAVDTSGNLYIANSERGGGRIHRVDTSGIITTVAGTGENGHGGDGGPAVAAGLRIPTGVALDGSGNLYIADTGNHRIRRVDAAGTITTIAGTGESSYSGDGGPATGVWLSGPTGVAVDGSGALYIAERRNHRIRRVDEAGTIMTVAGIGERGYSGDGGPATGAWLYHPREVAVDNTGALYIAERRNHRIRRVDKAGRITTVAGNGERGYGGDGGPAAGAWLYGPTGVAVDSSGALYIVDSENHRIRRVDKAGRITTVAGNGETGYRGDGGPAAGATLYYPYGLAVDNTGNLYIADTWNHRIRRVDAGGTITTVAGNGGQGFGGGGGLAVRESLNNPTGVAVDEAGSIYIADSGNYRIRRVDAGGTITTVAGIGGAYDSGGAGPAAEAVLNQPQGVAVDGSGNVYIADTYNHRVRRVDVSGTLTTIAGTGVSGYGGDGGLAATAQLNHPTGVAVDEAGNVYVADSRNHRIRVLTRLPPPPGAPTRLKATAASPFRIDLSWRDNSDEEEGFRVQRRVEGSSQWVDIGATAADLTTYSDTGLEPATTYRYRVRAYRNLVASAFSNEAAATTPRVMPPTLMRFMPTSGPVGSRVTLVGTHFYGATAVEFNGAPAARFEVVSGTRIEAVVPPGASSGPIRVVAPGGAVTSAESFTVTESGIGSRLFVPVVLRGRGRTPGSFFTSELTLTNRGSSTAAIHYTYTASFGGDSGTAVEALGPGRQRVILDAIAYLTDLGVPIGSGTAGGTLAVDFSNLSSPSDAAVTVRVATPVKEGRAGLAYLGLTPEGLLTGPAFITGLRQNNQDRSNLAVQNAGVSGNGNITLRVTVYSGNPEAPGSLVLPDRFLEPGGFHQYNGILKEAGFDNGYVKVERVAGTAPFYAYGVINDQANSDGSFVFPVSESSVAGSMGQVLPVVVEVGLFTSELTVTNFSEEAKAVTFSMVADAIETEDHRVAFTLPLRPGQQYIIPNAIEEARQRFGINLPRGLAVPLFASAVEGDLSGVVMGARTGSQADPEDVSRGRYSVFYTAVPQGVGFTDSAWIYGLQQNAENRSNLALVNSGEVDDSPGIFSLEIYNGETGRRVRTITRTVPAQRWHQLDSILLNHGRGARQGYVRILKTSGNNPFLAYGVINDGGARGERSDDGAYVPARE